MAGLQTSLDLDITLHFSEFARLSGCEYPILSAENSVVRWRSDYPHPCRGEGRIGSVHVRFCRIASDNADYADSSI